MCWHVIASVLVMVTQTAGYGPEAPVSTIETEGVAVVDAVPTYVEFWLQARCQGNTIAEATEAALRFEPAVRKVLKDAELNTTALSFTGVAVPTVQRKEAHISARVRLSASTYMSAEEGPRLFALLCDKMTGLAGALSCTIEGPALGVDDKESIEAAAIGRATEKAYMPAKAAAQVMNGQIVAVDTVSVYSLVWNKAPDVLATQPDLKKLTCTATVKVTYAFSSVGP